MALRAAAVKPPDEMPGLDDNGFAVALVPHTLEETTLGEAAAGDEVNLETDVLAKYVERLAGLRSDDGDRS